MPDNYHQNKKSHCKVERWAKSHLETTKWIRVCVAIFPGPAFGCSSNIYREIQSIWFFKYLQIYTETLSTVETRWKNLFSRKIKMCFYWRHLLKCNHSKLKVHRVCRQTCDGDRIRGNQCNASDHSSLETRKISYYGDPCTICNCSPSTPWMTSSSSSLLYFFQIASML